MVKSFVKMETDTLHNGMMINVKNEKSFLRMEVGIQVNVMMIIILMDMDIMLTQTITNI